MYTIEPVGRDWSDETVADVNAFENGWRIELDPEGPLLPTRASRAHLDLREEANLFVARDAGGAVVGSAWVDTPPHNRDLAFMLIATASRCRRSGVATKLLAAAAGLADEDGRKQIVFGCDALNDGAEAFAASLGAAVGLKAHVNRLVIADVDRAQMQAWADHPADDYDLEWVPDGRYSDQWLPEIARLRSVLLNDAPMDDVPVERRSVPVDEVRDDDARLAGYGRARWTLIARHRASGEPVGCTEMMIWPHDRQSLWQGATAVDGNHRGHSLGRRLKATMFHRIIGEFPETKYITTFNADSNEPMLAVNNAMGFKPHRAARRWVIETRDALAWLEKRK